MNHGYDDDDEEYNFPPPIVPRGPGGILAQLMGGFGGQPGFGGFGIAPPPEAFDDYFKAYSVAVMSGKERAELMYGGKIVMPPSALAKLSALDIPGPWTFQLRNPRNPSQYRTHAGVLEFIADEGNVHLPAWMMKTLNLEEGDPIRLTGAKLPKGKLVKLQAQSTDFLQVSDPRAVLESALRFYSTLTKNDMIEVTYNSITFEFLVMDTQPEGAGISVIDTDLEVDFATPKGYVEPARAAPVPIPTMAEKLKIDLNNTQSAGSSRPGSSLGARTAGSGDSTPLESFTGVGQSVSGKRIKGKGLAKKIEIVDSSSKINRADGPRIITPESLNDADRKVPAALVLPAGKFFFGYKYTPYDPTKAPKPKLTDDTPPPSQAFQGEGNSLANKGKGKGKASSVSAPAPTDPAGAGDATIDPWAKLGSGNTLRQTTNARSTPVAPAVTPTRNPAPAPPPPQQHDIIDATMLDEDDFWEAEDDDDDVIEIDSD